MSAFKNLTMRNGAALQIRVLCPGWLADVSPEPPAYPASRPRTLILMWPR